VLIFYVQRVCFYVEAKGEEAYTAPQLLFKLINAPISPVYFACIRLSSLDKQDKLSDNSLVACGMYCSERIRRWFFERAVYYD
jgi:hypothetical protein